MPLTPTEDQRICAWFERQSEETLRDLQDRFDAVSPRQCWNAFFADCPPPAPQNPGACLSAPAAAVQEVCSRSGFVVPFPSEDKGIDREAYRAAVLDLAALLSEEAQIFDQLALGFRQIASDSVAQHRGELDNLVEGCISHMRRFYGVAAQDVSELNSVHSSSLA